MNFETLHSRECPANDMSFEGVLITDDSDQIAGDRYGWRVTCTDTRTGKQHNIGGNDGYFEKQDAKRDLNKCWRHANS